MDRTEYIGEETYLFYDIETGCIYKYNGLPGGELIAGCGAGGAGNDNVDSFPSITNFPAPGAADVIYIAEDTNIIYRWDGSTYVPLNASGVSDEVLEYTDAGSFPAVGETETIYIAADTNIIYRWDGSGYVPLSGGGHDYATITIPASSTVALYSIVPAGNLSLKFIISAVDNVNGNFASSEVLGAFKLLDNSVDHTHYALIGDRIKYQPNLVYSGPDVQLNIVNNEVNPLTVSVMRVPTLPL
jgi:hypothetical protein